MARGSLQLVVAIPASVQGDTSKASMSRIRHLGGYALPMVLLFSAVMAAAIVAYMNRLVFSADTSGSVLKRKQAFYVADGIARAGGEIAANTLLGLPPPDATTAADPAALAAFLDGQRAQVQSALDERRPQLETPGFVIRKLAITGLEDRTLGTLQSGPFRGMMAQLQPMTLEAEAAHAQLVTGSVSSTTTSIERGTMSMFQFFAFIDGYAYLYSGTGAAFAGRIHANGNVCMGSQEGALLGTTQADAVLVEKLTSAERFFVSRSSGCRDEDDYHVDERAAYIATRPLSGLAELDGLRCDEPGDGCVWVRAGTFGTDAGQVDSDGPGAGPLLSAGAWRSLSQNRWNGQLQDAAHGVPRLGVPILGDPVVQNGRNASHAAASNNENSRFLVDPVLATEPEDVRAQKFAFKADIRIMNGVWYVRDAADPSRIGTPIWSDHPGSYTTRPDDDHWADTSTRAVGQADLASLWGSTPPSRFSYYRTDPLTGQVDFTPPAAAPFDNRPVLSYGVLSRQLVGTAPIWVPGFYSTTRCSALPLASRPPECEGSVYGWALQRAATPRDLLLGTRAGFRNGWGEVSAIVNDRNQTANLMLAPNDDLGFGSRLQSQLFNMLPINFDVEAFAAALADATPGELGSYFPGGRFNGIVWIGASWPGQLDGMGDTPATSALPRFWPLQGAQDDNDSTFTTHRQPFPSSPAISQTASPRPPESVVANPENINNEPFQRALPFPLCTDSGGPALYSSGGVVPGADDAAFIAPQCSRYGDTAAIGLHARPNAVRVINGRHIDRDVFPAGLTIATNLPAFILGDFNSTSVPSDAVGEVTPEADWRPALVAADSVSLMSNNWSDANAPWNVRIRTFMSSLANPDASRRRREATTSTYHMQVLAGWLESDNGNRDELAYFPRLLENWSPVGVGRVIRGSMFIGFHSLFSFRFDWNDDNSRDGNDDGLKVYGYDYNLDLPANQPPGTPLFQVTATRTFRRN